MGNAICKGCNREMNGSGCGMPKVIIGGKTYNRISYDDGYTTCHDCNTPDGKIHHLGCDMERCPACGGQLAFCECDVTHLSM